MFILNKEIFQKKVPLNLYFHVSRVRLNTDSWNADENAEKKGK